MNEAETRAEYTNLALAAALFVVPGNATLPSGRLPSANQEIGVPGAKP